jgi:predicted DNA-binding protein
MKNLGELVGREDPEPETQAPAGETPAPAPAAETSAAVAESQPAPEPQAPAEDPDPAPAPIVAPKPAPRKPRAARATAPVDEDHAERETASKGVPVHLTEELNERLQAYMTRKRWSHQTVLLDAIEATYTQLPELIRHATAADDENAERTPLFDRPSRPAPKASGEARVKHTVRMSDSNRNTLDRITEELGAPSRNFVITVAYEAYLPHIEKS